MNAILQEERFNFISDEHKGFIAAFDDALTRLGYDFGNKIGPGYCWGKYMLIYRKTGVKSENVYARIYIRDETIVLRLFLNNIDKHRKFIETAPGYIKEVFTGDQAKCMHDKNEKDGKCRFRKTYTIDGQLFEKCNGITFEFQEPNIQKMGDYLALFTEFFPGKKNAA
jgi:spermidine/putrescine-binding protein